MNLGEVLLRENSYNTNDVSRQMLDYGGFYHIQYTDTTSDKQPDKYFIFVVHPRLKNKTHCLDLGKIEERVFNDFFEEIRLDNEEEVRQAKANFKGYVKRNIRIGTRFYDSFIKPNDRLLKNKPYKTLEFNRIQNPRYIAYDLDKFRNYGLRRE